MSSAGAAVSLTSLLVHDSSGPVASLQGGLELRVNAGVEASRCGLFSFPCLRSCRSELGRVKGVSCWLFARLLVDLHHLLGWSCQLAHPLGKFQEAYRNLTRNLSSSINLLVSPCLLPERCPAHSSRQPCSAALPLAHTSSAACQGLFRACTVVDCHFLLSNTILLYIYRGRYYIFKGFFLKVTLLKGERSPGALLAGVEVQGGTSSKLSPALIKAQPAPMPGPARLQAQRGARGAWPPAAAPGAGNGGWESPAARP